MPCTVSPLRRDSSASDDRRDVPRNSMQKAWS
ncbi:hypothetical protein CPT_Momento_007 [Burkholderia phage Momento]|uniref:Uncharacterized protein n=1 Tax=Burkholderia phage Momento TaxID=2924902 RepID=A0AAE9K650_9CAUD|nr:hypothetical protein CPT_Momento_007 [Burkholderia phage Momento]